MISGISSKGDNFCDFPFASLDDKTFPSGKEFALRGAEGDKREYL